MLQALRAIDKPMNFFNSNVQLLAWPFCTKHSASNYYMFKGSESNVLKFWIKQAFKLYKTNDLIIESIKIRVSVAY